MPLLLPNLLRNRPGFLTVNPRNAKIICLMSIYFIFRYVIRKSMSTGIGSQHAGAGRARTAQSFATRLVLLFQAILPQQPAQTYQVCHEVGERTGARRCAHTPGHARLTNFEVCYIIITYYSFTLHKQKVRLLSILLISSFSIENFILSCHCGYCNDAISRPR